VSPVCLELLALEAAALNANPHRLETLATPGWLERVRDRVRDDTRAVPTLAELANDAGVSRAHLARMFRARFGCTIGQYVRGQRLEVARRLILRTETPLSAVAFEAGFADQSHMTRSVTMRFGAPPGRLRAQRRSA
jgi:AraC family transcriptional regulator